jgi:hypothetical protein
MRNRFRTLSLGLLLLAASAGVAQQTSGRPDNPFLKLPQSTSTIPTDNPFLNLPQSASTTGLDPQSSGKTGVPEGGSEKKDQAPPSKLEQALAQALKNNPDIRVAEAKAQEAEAELARTRLAVAQKVVTLVARTEAQEKVVEDAERRLRNMRLLGKAVSEEELQAAGVALQKAKADLAVLHAEMVYLTGKDHPEGAKGTSSGGGREAGSEKQVPQGPVADKIRAALDKRVSLQINEERLDVVFDYLSDASGVQLRLRPGALGRDTKLESLNMKEVPLASVLQYLEDSSPHPYRFVVRDYGLLFCPAADLPPGAVLLSDFRKGGTTGKAEDKPGAGNPPADLQGRVLSTEEGGLVKVSLGSDAGLQKGHTLEVFRLDGESGKGQYVGRVVVVEVRPKEAVCRATGRMTGPVKAGDHVASRLINP